MLLHGARGGGGGVRISWKSAADISASQNNKSNEFDEEHKGKAVMLAGGRKPEVLFLKNIGAHTAISQLSEYALTVFHICAALELYRRQLQRSSLKQRLARAHGRCLAALHIDLDGCGSLNNVRNSHYRNVINACIVRQEVVTRCSSSSVGSRCACMHLPPITHRARQSSDSTSALPHGCWHPHHPVIPTIEGRCRSPEGAQVALRLERDHATAPMRRKGGHPAQIGPDVHKERARRLL